MEGKSWTNNYTPVLLYVLRKRTSEADIALSISKLTVLVDMIIRSKHIYSVVRERKIFLSNYFSKTDLGLS